MKATTRVAFKGAEELIERIDDAVARSDPRDVVHALRRSMCAMIRDSDVRLPDCVFEPHHEHYARRELYRSPHLGYSVIAMTWGPGQGTPIHDHSGMWCVEGVWAGEIEVVQYELREQSGDRFQFESVGGIQAGQGSAGSLIPPHEYHTIANPSADAIAVSVHVYRAEMTQCNVFRRVDGDWYERCPRRLGLDH
jgi:predicted metal-dependent enzyme (double-stranded beta helix superfamily)